MYRNPPPQQPQFQQQPPIQNQQQQYQQPVFDPRNPQRPGVPPQPQFQQHQFQQPQPGYPPQPQFQQPQPGYPPQPQFQQPQPGYPPQHQFQQPQFQQPQQPGGFGRSMVSPMDNHIPPPDRSRRKRTSTVSKQYPPTPAPQPDVYDKVEQDMILGLTVGVLVEPGVSAVAATTDDGSRVYIYKGDSKMKVVNKVTSDTEQETVSAIPDVNIKGDYTHALIQQGMVKNKADIGYATVTTAYSFVTSEKTRDTIEFSHDLIDNFSIINAGITCGNAPCEHLDSILTGYVNTYLYATNTGINIDSLAADYDELTRVMKNDFSDDVYAGYSKLMNVISLNISETTTMIDGVDTNIETLCNKQAYIVIDAQDPEEQVRVGDLLNNDCITLTDDSAPVTKDTIDNIRENFPSSIMYLLTDDYKYYVVSIPGTNSVYIKKVVS